MGATLNQTIMAIQYGLIPLEDGSGQGDANPSGAAANFLVISDFTSNIEELGGTFYDGNGQSYQEVTQVINGIIVEDLSWSAADTNNVNTLWTTSFGAGNPNDGNVNNFVRFSDFANRANLGLVLDLNGAENNWVVLIDITGSFSVDETLTQNTPNVTATIREVLNGNLIRVDDPNSPGFQEGEVVTTPGGSGTVVQYLPKL